MLADRFRRGFVESGEPGAIKRFVTLLDPFGEWIGRGQHIAGFDLRRAQVLFRLVFTIKGANLDQPAAAGANPGRLGAGNFGLRCNGFSRY